MIEIGINKVYKNYGYKNVLENFTIDILTGQRIGVVGKNGSGKTTLFKIISKKENIDKGTLALRKGATIGYLQQIPDVKENYETVQSILMDKFTNIFLLEEKLHNLEQEMAKPMPPNELEIILQKYTTTQDKFLALDGYSITQRFNKVVSGFNLDSILMSRYNVLSGGQKTIVNLASIILEQPDILLLDEPTNHLDINTLEWFESFLTSYKGTVVIISHDRFFLDKVTNKTLFLDKGKCYPFHGGYSSALLKYNEMLMFEYDKYQNQQKKISKMTTAAKQLRDWGNRSSNEKFHKRAKNMERRIEKMNKLDNPLSNQKAIELSFTNAKTSKKIVVIENLTVAYDTSVLLSNVSTTIYKEDKVCLMGANGSGKSSLVKEIINGNSHISLANSTKIGYIPQEIIFENNKLSVVEYFYQECDCNLQEARRILATFHFKGESTNKRIGMLSGGEKVLLKLAILIQNEINLLILDEPTNHIDIEVRELLEHALIDYQGTLLFICHDRTFITKIATKIIEIKDFDLVHFDGTYDQYCSYKRDRDT